MCSNQKVRAVVIRTVARLHSFKDKMFGKTNFLKLVLSFTFGKHHSSVPQRYLI